VVAKAEGEAPVDGSSLTTARAGLTITLKGSSAFLFKSTECTFEASDNAYLLKDEVDRVMANHAFDSDEVWIVTDTFNCEVFTLLMSDGKNATVEFAAKAGVGEVDESSLVDLSAGLTYQMGSTSGLQIEAQRGGKGIMARIESFKAKKKGLANPKAGIARDGARPWEGLTEMSKPSADDLLIAIVEPTG